MMMALLLIFLVIVLCLNLDKKRKGSTENDGTKAVQIMEPLKYLGNFWRFLEMSLIYFEIILILTWSANCVISKYSDESRYNICNN